ncbi:MAG: hypothetical protein V3W09_02525 [Nitrososphaerales archaeon]
MSPAAFRDREFLRTPEDLFFCIVGELHPQDRAISYLRYTPSSQGLWSRGGKHYGRAMPSYSITHLLRNIDLLKKTYPDYVFHSDVFNVEISAVPRRHIIQRYISQVKMKQLSEMKRPDILQKRAVELAAYLSETAYVPPESFGVTGSVLIDLHNLKFSDIDLTVSGGENGLKLKDTLPHLYTDETSQLKSIPKPVLKKWYKEKVDTHHISLNEAKAIQKRQWNYGSFKGTVFSLHPVRSKSEITERYGDHHFHPVGIVTGRAVISGVSESLFNPHIYRVETFKVQEGTDAEDIREVVTYSGLYGGIYEEGEEVSVHGKLEYVEDTRKGGTYHRVLVGSPEAGGHDYIKPISEDEASKRNI